MQTLSFVVSYSHIIRAGFVAHMFKMGFYGAFFLPEFFGNRIKGFIAHIQPKRLPLFIGKGFTPHTAKWFVVIFVPHTVIHKCMERALINCHRIVKLQQEEKKLQFYDN